MKKRLGYSGILCRIDFHDECVFHVSRLSRIHNTPSRNTEIPRGIQQNDLHIEKVAVWCADHVNGFLFLYTVNDKTVRVFYHCKSAGCLSLWSSEFRIKTVFLQDGAPLHIKRTVSPVLDEMFSDSWFGRYVLTDWPAKSPDSTHWGCLVLPDLQGSSELDFYA